MQQLQKLLDERWPLNSDLSDTDRSTMEMFRRIFTEGYNADKEDNLKHHGNTLLVSVASDVDEKGELASDLMLEGEATKIGSALAVQMQKHPELLEFIEYSLSLYDKLTGQEGASKSST